MFPKWSDWDIGYTRKGLIKRRIRQSLTFIAFAVSIVGLYRIRWNGDGYGRLHNELWRQGRGLVVGLLNLSERVIGYLRASVG